MVQHPEQSPAADGRTVPDAAQPAPGLADRPDVQALIKGVNDALAAVPAAPAVPTSFRDRSPVPAIGTAPPVAQPGRPPMSQRATDASALMLAAGAASVPIGGSAALVLWALGHVDPVALAVAAAAPVGVLTALARVIGRVKATVEAAPPTHHHHYAGPVRQDMSRHSATTYGVIARTTVHED
ncbi:hypothetical protein [Streptomyces griseofuscus]|uniref:hypothetical protein n=1 Tax=Streptomyces griseofuscus TaxID=146922 RepID=UPI0033F8AE68